MHPDIDGEFDKHNQRHTLIKNFSTRQNRNISALTPSHNIIICTTRYQSRLVLLPTVLTCIITDLHYRNFAHAEQSASSNRRQALFKGDTCTNTPQIISKEVLMRTVRTGAACVEQHSVNIGGVHGSMHAPLFRRTYISEVLQAVN